MYHSKFMLNEQIQVLNFKNDMKTNHYSSADSFNSYATSCLIFILDIAIVIFTTIYTVT